MSKPDFKNMSLEEIDEYLLRLIKSEEIEIGNNYVMGQTSFITPPPKDAPLKYWILRWVNYPVHRFINRIGINSKDWKKVAGIGHDKKNKFPWLETDPNQEEIIYNDSRLYRHITLYVIKRFADLLGKEGKISPIRPEVYIDNTFWSMEANERSLETKKLLGELKEARETISELKSEIKANQQTIRIVSEKNITLELRIKRLLKQLEKS